MWQVFKIPLEAMESTQYPVDPRKMASHRDVEVEFSHPYLQKVFIPCWGHIYYENIC